MSDPSGSDPSGDGAREAAKIIADQIAPLIRRARAKGFDFLAYLLAMALKESRRLSGE
jgi:hypothetical protein